MGCVRKRGKSWNAQVRVSGWRSFTKSFSKKSDAVSWINELEHKLRSAPLPDVIIDTKVTLGELLLKYAEEISPTHKGCVPETCRLKSIAGKWIGELDIRYLTKQHFIQYRDDRLRVAKGESDNNPSGVQRHHLLQLTTNKIVTNRTDQVNYL